MKIFTRTNIFFADIIRLSLLILIPIFVINLITGLPHGITYVQLNFFGVKLSQHWKKLNPWFGKMNLATEEKKIFLVEGL